MKREIKQEQKVGQAVQVSGPSPSKRAKVIVNSARTAEKTNPVKQQSTTVFEETKTDLVVVPRSNASVVTPETQALVKKSRKSPETGVKD